MQTPQQAGFRWPAEWERHRATWLSWPHQSETWPGLLDAVEAAFVRMVEALTSCEQVCIIVQGPAMEERVRGLLRRAGCEAGVSFFHFPTDDFQFRHFYDRLRSCGYIIYPGKVTDADTFRIGTIGSIDRQEIEGLLRAVAHVMKE